MYYPIQIPNILDSVFLENISYTEKIYNELADFVICYWQMVPIRYKNTSLNNIVILDGCIDLVVDFKNKTIGFTGMSSTNFNFIIDVPTKFMGLRLMPGAFYQLTKTPAEEAMDNFIYISTIYDDFDIELFFKLSFDKAKSYLVNYMIFKTKGLIPNAYTKLFNKLENNPPDTVTEICEILNLSQSQCQRNFKKHYGLTPKSVLSILRFQKALAALTTTESNDILELVRYYDQSHFINDFKRNIGITPLELISKYKR